MTSGKLPFRLVLILALAACTPAPVQEPAVDAPPVEASSLLGRPLHRPELSPEFAAQEEAVLAEAEVARAGS